MSNPKMAKTADSNHGRRILAYIVLGILTVLCLIWFVLLIMTTTKNHADLTGVFTFKFGGSFIDNFKSSLTSSQNIFRGMLNSFIISGSCALLTVYFSTVTAYAIHAYDFKGKGAIFTFILAIMMIPGQVTILGFLDLLRAMNLMENYTGLIIPSIAAPVTFYYIKQYMESALPMSLIEAARIDGSGEIRTFNTIALPLMKPAIAVQAIFAFVGQWNNFFIPSQVIIKNRDLKTVALLIADLRSSDWLNFDLGQVYMTIFLAIMPVIIVYMFLSKYIVGGLALGSVKG